MCVRQESGTYFYIVMKCLAGVGRRHKICKLINHRPGPAFLLIYFRSRYPKVLKIYHQSEKIHTFLQTTKAVDKNNLLLILFFSLLKLFFHLKRKRAVKIGVLTRLYGHKKNKT